MGAYRTVVVGTDGSDSSFRAVDRAAAIARDSQARLVIVCAYTPATGRDVALAQDELGADAYKVVGSAPAEDTLRAAAERVAELGVPEVERLAVEGEPVRALVDTLDSYRADLLVVGNRGLATLAGRLLGSVPAAVSRRAPCDVLIVHTVS
jgi:nucleotide-binding universal stress UspA family protein